MARLPSLLRYQLRQYTWAALVTALLMLVALLVLTDQLALRVAAHNLADELNSGEATTNHFSSGRGRAGHIALDAQGIPVQGSGQPYPGGRGHGWGQAQLQTPWALAPKVLAQGKLQGTSALPWVVEPVVWAARAVNTDSGEVQLLVAWLGVKAIRTAAGMTYLLVALAIALSFLVGFAFSTRSIRQIAQGVSAVVTAGHQMASGSFKVELPPQSTSEFEELCLVINELARHLDTIIKDLRLEHSRLSQLEQAQRRFLADASHELRRPLSAMAITLDAWHDGVLQPEEQPEAIAMLRVEAKRLGRFVTELLDLSRLESGRATVALESLDVAQICAEVTKSESSMPGAQILMDIPPDIPQVLADRDGLYRVLRNLLDNALRFTPLQGEVKIWARRDEAGVRLGVTDTGPGIAPDVLPYIWDRFARQEPSESESEAGTGLGLAIVKALVEAMGGQVGVQNNEGEGATVWIILLSVEDVSEE